MSKALWFISYLALYYQPDLVAAPACAVTNGNVVCGIFSLEDQVSKTNRISSSLVLFVENLSTNTVLLVPKKHEDLLTAELFDRSGSRVRKTLIGNQLGKRFFDAIVTPKFAKNPRARSVMINSKSRDVPVYHVTRMQMDRSLFNIKEAFIVKKQEPHRLRVQFQVYELSGTTNRTLRLVRLPPLDLDITPDE